MKKYLFVALALWSTLALRADLLWEQQFASTNGTGRVSLKLHDDKMRMDQEDSSSNAFSVIIDLKTRDSYTLIHKAKSYRMRSGQDIVKQIQDRDPKDPINQAPPPAVDTGKTESVAGLDAKIFTWSGVGGGSQTMWVATNYPNGDAIRRELAKIDAFDQSGPHRGAQPQLSRLPGVVIKSVVVSAAKKETTVTLVTASVEPLSPSLFELPRDYTLWVPPVKSATSIPVPK